MTSGPSTPEQVGPEWVRLLRVLPGFDPFRSTGGAWFDAEAAQHAIAFIHECLRHVEGALAGEPFILEEWERALVANIFGWKRKDAKGRVVRRFREALLYVPRKNGKALALDTPIPTPDGWKAMGDLVRGDCVFDERGEACRVVDAHPVMHGHTCYRVAFSDGTSITADAEHLWTLHDREDGERKLTITTEQVAAAGLSGDVRRYALPRVQGLRFPAVACPDVRVIKAVDSVPSVPVRCIRVDSPSSLFLAGPGMVPTHNSPLCAAIALLVFFTDGEAGQQDYIAAADREQAGMLFRQCKGMVDQEPELARRCRIYGGNASAGQSRSIVRDSDGSFLRVISADADTKHGGNSHLIIVDELHAQPNRDLVDVLTTSTASLNRKQPLTLFITTADFDRPSICNEIHDRACKVRDGIIDDPAFLPVIYEAARDADWTDPKVWAEANPNLGVSVSLEYLERECKKAKETPAYENTFKRLHLNMRTATDTRAVPMEKWDACPTFDPAELEGAECWGGLDLSTTTDLSAFALLFRLEGRPDKAPSDWGTVDLGRVRWAAILHFWAPRNKARHRSRTDRVPYELWAEQGHIKLTDGDVTDYDVIRADIVALREKYDIREIAADRWNATQILSQLQQDGFDVVAFGQGMQSMTAPTKELLALVASGRIMHNGNPVLRWMASNLATESDAAGNLKPSKKKSSDRIDGCVAVVMSLGRAMISPENEAPSVEVW